MTRCQELAVLGAGHVAPNPLVGSVLVHNGRIIGEGYHHRYGEAHAERNCINSVAEGNRRYIPDSTLYVSLEPCAHFGKTPPCADLIIEHGIRSVVVGCRDPFPAVNGKGIDKLTAAGVQVNVGVLEKECLHLNRRFMTFHRLHRPYIILKWAQTSNGRVAGDGDGRLLISGDIANRLVHRWRSEEAAILVGSNTAFADDPALTTRLWRGPNPLRVLIDPDLRIPRTARLFNDESKTIVFNTRRHGDEGNISYWQITRDVSVVAQVCNALYQLGVQSVMIEGGTRTIQSFIDEGCWDEARRITNRRMLVPGGLAAPVLPAGKLISSVEYEEDLVEVLGSPENEFV